MYQAAYQAAYQAVQQAVQQAARQASAQSRCTAVTNCRVAATGGTGGTGGTSGTSGLHGINGCYAWHCVGHGMVHLPAYIASKIPAAPIPVPTHMVTMPYLALVRRMP